MKIIIRGASVSTGRGRIRCVANLGTASLAVVVPVSAETGTGKTMTILNSRAAIAAALAVAAALSAGSAQANAVTDINAAMIDAIRIGGTPPPRASRAIAMVDIAVYDAVNAATGLKYDSYFYSGAKAGGISADAAAYVAGYTMLSNLFPSQAATFSAAMNNSVAALHLTPARQAAATALGASIANGYFAARCRRCRNGADDLCLRHQPRRFPEHQRRWPAGVAVMGPGRPVRARHWQSVPSCRAAGARQRAMDRRLCRSP